MVESTQALLAAVVASELGGSDETGPLVPEALDDEAFAALVAASSRARVAGSVVSAVFGGVISASDDQAESALEAHRRALAIDVVLDRLLISSTDALGVADIPVRVLKGAAVAHTVYDDPAMRSYGDVDLLVPAERYDEAVGVLEATGRMRRYAEPRAGFDRRFGKGACLVGGLGEEVDLHRTFVAGPFGIAVHTEDLFLEPERFRIGGRELEALDLTARFVNACFHAALGNWPPRIAALRDVAQFALNCDLDLSAVVDRVGRWRCGIVVQSALDSAWRTFGLAGDPAVVEWGRSYEPSRFERRALKAYVGERRSYRRQAVAGIWAVPGLRAKAGYTSALLWPERDYVNDRDGSYWRRLRRGAGAAAEHLRAR